MSQGVAQTPDTVVVAGQVLDQSRAPIPGVDITVTNKQTGLARSAQTDSMGNFSVGGLPASGSYDLSAHKTSFTDAQVPDINVVGGSAASITLQLGVPGEKTEITVTGVSGEVRTDLPQIGIQLDQMQVQETPLLNRRITFLPLLSAANRPAINQGDVFMNQNMFTTNGTGRRQAWFEVDGANSVDLWGRQTIFTNLSQGTLQEMGVLTSPFSAEYGFSAGSTINMVTRSGGNQYHGSILGNFRPADTSAKLAGFTAQTAANGNSFLSDELYQTMFTFGGPIGSSNRTHFFTSGEYSWENRVAPINSPVAPGSFEGKYRDWMALVRLDHQITGNNNVFLRANADSFVDTNPNGTVGGQSLPTVDRVFKRKTYSLELGDTAVISPTLINNARAQFQLASPITQFDPVIFGTQFVVPIGTGGSFTTGTSQSALLMNRQFEFNDTVSLTHGRHNLRFGGQVIYAHTGGNSKEFGGPIFLGRFTFNPCSFDLETCETSYITDINNVANYTQSFGNADYSVDDTLWSLFVQDDFRLRPNLTINLGLRYDRQTFTDSNKNFAPRVGFVWNPWNDGNTVIRGGFGIYYSQIVDNSQANYELTGPTGVFNFTATPGQIGFPDSISDAPLPEFPAGGVVPLRTLYIRLGRSAQLAPFLDTSLLTGYQSDLVSPYTEQWTFGFEHSLARNWVLSLDYVGSHSVKVNRPLDVDPPVSFVRTAQGQSRLAQKANCTRPLWVDFYLQNGFVCDETTNQGKPSSVPIPAYSLIQSDVNDGVGYYHALNVNLNHRFGSRLQMLASYTWSHAINNVDPDVPGQNPNDPNVTGRAEFGPAIYDQRQRFVLSGLYTAPFKITFGGVGTIGTGLPFNVVTGSNNSGDTGGTTDRPFINGAIIGRNAGRGNPIYDVSPFIERPFALGSERVQLLLRVEAFNVFNHANFVGYSGTFGNGLTPNKGFGGPLQGITNQLPPRSLQFSAKLTF